MIKTALIENNPQDIETISSYFENSSYIDFIGVFDDFSKIDLDVDLIIFNINRQNCQNYLSEIKKLNPEIKFIAISDDFDSSLAENVKKQVCDFLFKPIIPAILEASVRKIKFEKKQPEKSPSQKAKTIGIFSLKGGVGKTSTALNTAFELSKNKNVCLLDFNTNSPDCSLYLGIEQKSDIVNLLEQFKNLDKKSALSIIPKYNSLYVLNTKKIEDFNFTLDKAKIIKNLENIFDYIIIDTYCNIDENNLKILGICDLILYISVLNKNTVIQTNQIVEMFSKIGYNQNKTKLILNRFIENSEISQNKLTKEVFAIIPNNYLALSDAINRQSPLALTNPQSNITKAFKELANKIESIDIQKENSINRLNNGIFDIIQKRGE